MYFAFRTSCYGNCAKFTLLCNTKIKHLLFCVWLEPSKETNTYGRDDFSIHGGWNLGSAGCIDMTGQINAFTSWLESTGKDLIIHVKY